MKLDNVLLFQDAEGSGGSSGEEEGTGEESGTQTPEPPEGTGKSADGTQNDSEIAKARKEAARYRTERNKLQKRVEELEGASKTEMEKAQDEAKDKGEKLDAANERIKNLQVQALAPLVGIAVEAASDAASLLNWSKVEDPEDPESVKKALQELVKAKPYLAGKVRDGGDGGQGGTRKGAEDMNSQIRAAAGVAQ